METTPQLSEYVLTLTCKDTPGIVFAVSSFLVQHSADIRQSQQYDDPYSGLFFMRVQFSLVRDDAEALHADFARIAQPFQMDWHLYASAEPTRTLLMVSKFGHCLNDLLYRNRIGALNIEIPAVVSNHREFEDLVTSYGIPFHHIPVTADTKADAEAQLLGLVDDLSIDLVVLARYMQVLSDGLCERLSGRAINIHHSCLPSFKGAKPYHQAYARGVKLIGATAHYVTSDLDEGPIIEQDVARAEHSLGPDDLIARGRDVEIQVLARAIAWHSEHRVLLGNGRTVVFH